MGVKRKIQEYLKHGNEVTKKKRMDVNKTTDVLNKQKKKKKTKKQLQASRTASDTAESVQQLPAVRKSDEPVEPAAKWTNKTRVLVFCSRGITSQGRHLMDDMRVLLPHSKSDAKLDRKDQLFVINEICELKNCRQCIFFEAKKKQDLYMWMSCAPRGPCVKFLVENIHTMLELKMTGNCLKGSRPLLSFDPEFDTQPHWQLLKEIFIQTFSTPNHHPQSKPFIDHVLTFSIADDRIWFRNYQILAENGELAEIGPRMVLNPIRIFRGSFIGETVYTNPRYKSPNEVRSMFRKMNSQRYIDRVAAKQSCEERRPEQSYEIDPTSAVFQND